MVRPQSPNPISCTHSLHTLSRSYTCMYMRGWLANSYAVPKEVGKVGVQSPTFIEPVQNRKDGIEAMFSRQAKAVQQQQKSASRDTPPAAAAGNGKRKRESSSPTEEKEEEKEKEAGTPVSTTAPSSPAKRSKVKKDPIKHDDTVDSEEEEGNSDVEILPSGPPQSVGHRTSLHCIDFLTHEMNRGKPQFFGFWGRTFRKRMKRVDRRLPSQRRRKRKITPLLLLLHPRARSSRSSSSK
jgi:hypothetical protein